MNMKTYLELTGPDVRRRLSDETACEVSLDATDEVVVLRMTTFAVASTQR